jgi:hypothetical protein
MTVKFEQSAPQVDNHKSRLPYKSPTLLHFGQISELTQSGSVNDSENNQSAHNMCGPTFVKHNVHGC